MIQKIYWHGVAIVKIILYRMMFGKGLVFPLSSTFREESHLRNLIDAYNKVIG